MAINDIPYLEIDLPGILVVGTDGKDAYEVACEAGFLGTREDWIKSLTGPQGVGIAKVYQAEESEEDEGENIIRLLLTDGQIVDIVIRNGSQGPTGTFSAEDAARMDTMEQDIADLKYKPIEIGSFSVTPATAEMGAVVDKVSLSWSRNKVPAALTLDGESIAPDAVSLDLTGLNLAASKTWTLRATDERAAASTKTTTLTFLNRICYGAAEAPEAIDSAFILSLTNKVLSGSKKRTITVNAGEGQYIWYCIPKRLGACSFKDAAGFAGGFDTMEEISFTNALGYTEDYYVYRSDQVGLNLTVEVS